MSLVHVDRTGTAATITLDSPANRNALSAQLRTELFEAITAAATNPEVRSIVVTHTGHVFCAGADLKEARLAHAASAPSGPDIPTPSVPDLLVAIWESPKPVIAALSGVARAGGLGIVAACDTVLATTDVTFACTEVRIGVVPAVISPVVLQRMTSAAAHQLFLTGETMTAAAAASCGLVDSVVAPDQLAAEIDRYTNAFALAAPVALAATKALTRSPQRIQALRQSLSELAELSASYFAADEGREGLAAFAEKRPPNWIR